MEWSVSNIKAAGENTFLVECKALHNDVFLTIEPSVELLNFESLSEVDVLSFVFSSIGQEKKAEFEAILTSRTPPNQVNDVQVPWKTNAL